MSESTPLENRRCIVCNDTTPGLNASEVEQMLTQLSGWQRSGDKQISKTYKFKDHYETMAFVNALVWISHREDHHPDLAIGYNSCQVTYWTHTVNGLSINDFICAAKVDALIRS